MHYLSVYFVCQPVHVWGVFIADHQEVHRMNTTIGTYCSFLDDCLLSWLGWNMYLLMMGYKYARNM
jgi:hypothetical protein